MSKKRGKPFITAPAVNNPYRLPRLRLPLGTPAHGRFLRGRQPGCLSRKTDLNNTTSATELSTDERKWNGLITWEPLPEIHCDRLIIQSGDTSPHSKKEQP